MEERRGIGEGLRVVAGGVRQNTACTLVRVHRGQQGDASPDLEGAGRLQVLVFDQHADPGADGGVEGGIGEQRGRGQVRALQTTRAKDVGDGRTVHALMLRRGQPIGQMSVSDESIDIIDECSTRTASGCSPPSPARVR